MNLPRAIVTAKGQVTLPASVRRALGLADHAAVALVIDGGACTVRSGPARPGELAWRLSTRGQLTLPQAVRRALGVGPGDDVQFELSGPDAVVLRRTGGLPGAAWRGIWQDRSGLDPAIHFERMRGP